MKTMHPVLPMLALPQQQLHLHHHTHSPSMTTASLLTVLIVFAATAQKPSLRITLLLGSKHVQQTPFSTFSAKARLSWLFASSDGLHFITRGFSGLIGFNTQQLNVR